MSTEINSTLIASLPEPVESGADSSNTSQDPNLIPLSFAQQRLWFLDQLEPNSPLYNIPTVVRITGRLDLPGLERALNAIVARHEILRTRIVCEEDVPAQLISSTGTIEFQYVDRTDVGDQDEKSINRVLQAEMSRPFNLSADRLVRALLVKVSAEEHFLVITMHHIVSDEWSVRIFFRELEEFYSALNEKRTPSVQELPIQYADYSIWQRDWMQREVLEEQLDYWKEKLKNSPSPLELLTDHPRTSQPSFKGGNLSRLLSKELAESLRKMANREGATLFMVLLAGFKTLLYRYTGQEDIIVASPIAGRTRVETEELIGLFVNTLALRTQITGNLTFRDILKRVRETTLGAYAHQELPFEKLVEELQPERSSHHLHFTNVMFVLQQSMPEVQFSGLSLCFPEVVSEMSKFEITLAIQETTRGLIARAEYNTDLFEPGTITRLLEHFETLLEAIAAQPEQQIGQVPLLSKREFHRIVVEWNRTVTEYPRDKCVHQLFDLQAASTPDAPAIVFANKSLSYRELNTRANQLAHLLKRSGVGPDVPVGICVNRSVEMVIGLLGILKAGGAYVPLDAGYPQERLEFMLADSGSRVLVTQQPLLSRLPRLPLKAICLDTDWELIAREPRNSVENDATAESLAYIMYTSGSTGQPKGVAVPHRAINRLVCNTNYIQLGRADRIAQISNLSFDAATFEVWGALLNGGQLIGITTDVALSPHDFAREVHDRQISGMFLTAALFNQLAAEVPGAFGRVRTLIAGGEALDPNSTREVLRHGPPERLLNGYGPTENTTFSCCHLIKEVPEDATNVPIGGPIANTTAFILDQNLHPVPVGVAGTLYLGGDGLARGYWNRPELTVGKFIPNPFGPGRIYNTGDLARYLPDGAIEFLGRKDEQVKIRGFRIELGEIEVILSQHKDVSECCVTATRDEAGQKRLTGYFVTKGEEIPTGSALRRFLSEKLPQYMVPAAFVQMPRLPLTPNGKIDRKALPEPGLCRPALERKYTSPRDAVEHEVTRIWEEVLGVHPIGIEDNFFDLGGHSLLAVRLVAQMSKSFEKQVRLATVFQGPTIEQMALVLREDSEMGKMAASSSLVEIQPKGDRPPLFLVHGAGGGMFWGYVNLARHLGNGQPVYGFRSRGLDGKNEFERLEQMAAQYIADLRMIQPHGPYCLGGYCFGGNVAYEMANQLSACGEKIRLLALINCAPPNSGYGHLQYTPKWLARFFRNLLYWAGYCAQWTAPQRREFFRWKVTMARKNLNALTGLRIEKSGQLDIENMVDLSSFSPEQQKLWAIHIRAQLNYKPKPFPGRVHLFRSPGHPVWCSFDPKYGWGELARDGVEVTVVPAGHEKILEEPFVKAVGEGLLKALEPGEILSAQFSESSNDDPLNAQSDSPRRIPLSFAQERVWLSNQLQPGNPASHQVSAFRLEGFLNPEALGEALNQLIRRHESLRTVYSMENGVPSGRVTSAKLKLRRIELNDLLSAENKPLANNFTVPAVASLTEQQILEAVSSEKDKPFDLTSEIPIRAALIQLKPNHHVLIVTIHEIAADKKSLRLFLNDFVLMYTLKATGSSGPRALPVQYADFAHWQRRQSEEGGWAEHLDHVARQMEGAPELLEFPASFVRPARQSYRSGRECLPIKPSLFQSITRTRQQLGIEGFDFFSAAVLVLLKRYIRQEESVLAIPVEGRDGTPFEKVIGNFENFVLLRADLSGDPLFIDLLNRFRQTKVSALAHKVAPFQRILQHLHVSSDQSYHPLAQVSFDFQKDDETSSEVAGLRISRVALNLAVTRFDLSLQVVEKGDDLILQVDYAKDLFVPRAMRRLLEHWQRLLEGITENPDVRVSQLSLLTTAEEQTLLNEWTKTQLDYPKDKTLVDLFSEQAARTPDKIAVVSGSRRLSYRDLRQKIAVVAGQLRSAGVKRETLVGVCLERSWEMVAGILGTLQAGAAYVPIDPAYPKERIEFMVQDAELPVILTQRKLVLSLPQTNAQIICVEDLDWQSTPVPVAPSADGQAKLYAAQATDLAYVIYTSGSTGKPKGVALEHRNAVAFVCWARSVFSLEELDGVLASTSICFDLSIFEMFVPLSWGGKVILAENALALPGLPASNEVRLINTVPSAIRELLRAKGVPASVRVVNLAGEPLPTPLVDQIYSESAVQKVYDLYGPTETTTYSTFTLRQPNQPATIGRPLANEQIYILDSQRQLVPIGVPGELYIGGDGLARGYLQRPELTIEKFVPHPFVPGARLYKTGDLARWREDGNLEFLGRIDNQVKIRGFRIELGEVENALKKQIGVSDAVVISREDPSGNKRLVAYVVFDDKKGNAVSATPGKLNSVWSEELRRGLRLCLPDYMIPTGFVFLDVIPLTPNGKVDRKALPAPEIERHGSDSGTADVLTPLQTRVANIWSEVLQVKDLGLNDNFFDLGGHSLLAFQIISRLRSSFKVEVPLSGLFETPTIASLASALDEGRWGAGHLTKPGPKPVPRQGALPISFVQERLWFLDQLNPGSPAYNVPMALRLEGPVNLPALQKALDQVVQRHEALRTTFHYSNGLITQVIEPTALVKIATFDQAADSGTESEARLHQLLNNEAQLPFDLSTGPLIRALLVRLNETAHAFLVVMHHTVSDGWSLAVFFRDLEAFYRTACDGKPLQQIPFLPVQYVDFAHWQRGWMKDRVLEEELDYWKQALGDAPTRVTLPQDRTEPVTPSGKAERRIVKLSREATAGIATLAHKGAGTPFVVLLAALGATLQKWTGQKDMVLGTVVAGRNHESFENVIGCFMNFLPIRIKISGEETAEKVLQQVKSTVLEAQNHQDCPFEKIVGAINPERTSNQNPLYNVGLLVQNFPTQLFHTDELESCLIPINLKAALLDLRFEAEQTGQEFTLSCEYKTELFDDTTIDETLTSMCRAIEWLVGRPESKLAELNLTSALEAQAAGVLGRKPAQLIAIASTFTAEPIEESLRYWTKELEIPANIEFAPYNQVFQQLLASESLLSGNQNGLNVLLLRLEDWQKQGDLANSSSQGDGDSVQRSADELVMAIKSSANRRSVPLLVCICPPSNKSAVDSPEAKHLTRVERCLSAELESLSGVYLARLEELWKYYPVADYYDPSGDQLGHVPYTPMMYTALGTFIARKLHALNRPAFKVIALDCDQTLWSGVCGEDGPEGILLDPPRLALQQFMRSQLDAGMLLCMCSKNNEEDVLQVFKHHKEMPLGCENFVAWRLNWESKSENLKSLAKELKLGLDSFIFVDDNPVECAAMQEQCPEVMTLLLPENPELIPQFLNHCWAFDHLKTTVEDRSRTEMYQQNHERQLLRQQYVSLGDFLKGLEIKIEIEPVTPDHLPRVAQLTQRTNQFNFTTHRRTENELQMLLQKPEMLTVSVSDRFGDYGLVGVMICRYQSAALETDTFLLSCRVLGRGVEHRMLAHLGQIAQQHGLSWVDVHYTKSDKNKPALDFLEKVGASFRQALNGGYLFRFPAGIAAALQLDGDRPEAIAEPSGHIPEKSASDATLPFQRFQRYRELALQSSEVAMVHESIEARAIHRVSQQGGYIGPRTNLERQLCELWQRLLRIERVGIRDNFFELGGHSLLAVRLFAELEQLTQRKLPLVTLFRAPTIEQLGGILAQVKPEDSHSLLVPIQPQGSKAPLFLVHGAGGDVLWGYANLAAHLPDDQPVYGIKSRGQAGLEELRTLEEMARGYLQEVQALQPTGPYHLGGYCFGGNVAYEMARQLHSQGEEVALLALLDSAPANAGYETIPWWKPSYAFRFAQNLWYWWTDFSKLDVKTRLNFVARKTRALNRKLKQRLHGDSGSVSVDIEDVIDPSLFPENELNLWKIHLRALMEHVQQPYDGSAILFRTRGQPMFSSLAEDFCWARLVEGVEVKSVPGSHESIFVEPNVQHLARELETALTAAYEMRAHLEKKPVVRRTTGGKITLT